MIHRLKMFGDIEQVPNNALVRTFTSLRAFPVNSALYVKEGSVMVSELSNEHRVIVYLVDEAMLIIDTPRPVAR